MEAVVQAHVHRSDVLALEEFLVVAVHMRDSILLCHALRLILAQVTDGYDIRLGDLLVTPNVMLADLPGADNAQAHLIHHDSLL